MNLLHTIGLMRRAEHEAACRPLRERLFDSEQKRIHWQGQSNEMTAKFKQAVADLEKQADEIESLKSRLAEAEADCTEWKGAALRNKDDAEKFRAKAKADAELKREKRAAAKKDQRP